jgi:uncharacterized protein
VLARVRAHEMAIRASGATGLFLFGSAARDEMTLESDVDVFLDVTLGAPLGLVQLSQLMRLFRGSLGRPVEVVTREGLHLVLRDESGDPAIAVF